MSRSSSKEDEKEEEESKEKVTPKKVSWLITRQPALVRQSIPQICAASIKHGRESVKESSAAEKQEQEKKSLQNQKEEK